jgi:hypothetical protein
MRVRAELTLGREADAELRKTARNSREDMVACPSCEFELI